MAASFWDDPDNQARLEELAKMKLSASMIGRVMGITRMSVIGRANRTGVKLKPSEHIQRNNGYNLASWNSVPENNAFRKKRAWEAQYGRRD